MQFSDLFGLEELVTPVVIKIVYWIGIVAGVFFGIGGFFVSIFQGSLTGGLMALVAMVLGHALVARHVRTLHRDFRDVRSHGTDPRGTCPAAARLIALIANAPQGGIFRMPPFQCIQPNVRVRGEPTTED